MRGETDERERESERGREEEKKKGGWRGREADLELVSSSTSLQLSPIMVSLIRLSAHTRGSERTYTPTSVHVDFVSRANASLECWRVCLRAALAVDLSGVFIHAA